MDSQAKPGLVARKGIVSPQLWKSGGGEPSDAYSSVDYYLTEKDQGPTFLYVPGTLIHRGNAKTLDQALELDQDLM